MLLYFSVDLIILTKNCYVISERLYESALAFDDSFFDIDNTRTNLTAPRNSLNCTRTE